jgi:two-component system chemotaxis sensor kinase CheA
LSQDPYRYFRIEARELVEQLGKGVLEIEREASPAVVSRLLRLAHTLKGAARIVKQAQIAERAHELEGLLEPLRGEGARSDAAPADRLLALLDAIGRDLDALGAPRESKPAPRAKVEPVRSARAEEVDELLEGLAEMSIQLRALRKSVVAAARARRVDELVEQELGAGLDLVERELGEVRGAAEKLRLVPVRSLFSALERVARDAAVALGRKVDFVAHGEELRVEAHVLAAVQSALVQLVRNAIAHAIEPERARIAAGKPAALRLEIAAARKGERVELSCRDDGAGFDMEAVRSAARQRGMAAEAVAAMSEAELLQLLLRGGLSTAGTVTEVSGRGVGLDVVREVVSTLGGDVRIESERGRGTRIVMTVPVTLSAVRALVVESSGATVAIPLDAVKRTFRVVERDVTSSAKGDTVVSGDEVLPLMGLGRALGRPDERRASSAVVVEGAQARAAIRVDRLIGTANLLVRSLPSLARTSKTIAGMSLDAEGDPQPLLDPTSLVALALRERRESASREGASERALPILVVDDSLTTRRLEQSILESAGYEVELAVDAEDGLRKARARRHAVFLVDVEMPGMDGFGFVEETRRDPALRDTPSILITSLTSAETRQRAQAAGARGYMAKSEFDQERLLEMIRRLQG